VAVAITTCASGAHAQIEVVSTVPFAFKAGNTMHPAGQYTLRTDDAEMTIQITPAHGRSTVVLAETRLGAPERPLDEGRLVFDKVGDAYYLSEVWTTGDDGFLLHVTKAKHTHVAVKLGKTS
jgi:hypothetical protein